jgi:hypothetical protein
MASSRFHRCGVSRVLAGVMWLSSINAFASSLTLCGVPDGGPGDPDGLADGSITTTCNFAGGSFTGTAGEEISPNGLSYRIVITGSFYGSAQDPDFVTGQFSLSGNGDVYPFMAADGLLASTTANAVSTGEEFLTLVASASNHLASPATAQITPVFSGPLPVPLEQPQRDPANGEFSGPGTLRVSLSYQTGGLDRYFDQAVIVQASTDPDRVIPEPSTVLLTGFGAAGLLVRARGVRGSTQGETGRRQGFLRTRRRRPGSRMR